MGHTLFELEVRLRGVEPSIWRTVEVPGQSTLEDVHYAIQLAMGWTNSHLHHFKIGDHTYGMVDVELAGSLANQLMSAVTMIGQSTPTRTKTRGHTSTKRSRR